MASIEIQGLRELKAKYNRDLTPAIVTGLVAIGHEIVSFMQEYPPSQSVPGRFRQVRFAGKARATKGISSYKPTAPKPMGWYERGRGWWYPIMQRYSLQSFGKFGKSCGVITGKSIKVASVAGYKLRAVSERLREKWTVMRQSNRVMVANSASYGPYVQKATKQSKLMQQIGWRTDQQAAEYVIQNGIAKEAICQAVMAKLRAK